jgi:hypothetical protein
VHLGAAHRHALVHQRPERELVHETGVDPEHEDRAALADGVDRLADRDRPVRLQPQLLLELVVRVLRPLAGRLHPDRFDAHVGPPAAAALA